MDWIQFTIFGTGIFALFFWSRSEHREDMRHVDAKLDCTRDLIMAIHQEMKDFHGRLCALEEKRKEK